ncbi:hypothetical protein wVul_0107 [Wolbachia endosymbiont of Armadillidium vulgare str. wVulC]|uniref:Uncharacterized protein n=1 Tax=Wolbachia endosymbiont of Armadillidium arcangelii TaxID=3158571 RepID=A0AAU7Q3I1_9RICK|nr:hypothetical protein [Wolbachia endosymbiont of Armadillidium vulgare]KLT22904.1 hypothetical protein wVul_0107 [Wolbachia endosymbiont of Armadillidium vulgare str. wVulC]OJH31621.1 hypothetical protein Wxf_01015 [Wolbachia endosymbiont of Armadillidium vulgare]OJH32030.1 hypothetical protein Wxf_01449 [Wolbachia endosymbiont of Armadillidium vulgare]OJH32587.1 hypothetical protein Wxf_02029 [Wolbachia endosymbiont of Armadillidium vulgare]OJH33209.1 hypothetical protein Wxf_02683 [Wolbach
MTIITADSLNTKHFSKGSGFGKDATVEDFFRDFWSGIEEEVERKKKLEQELLTLEEEKKKKKLEQELLTLKKRELHRKYVSLATMVPFALFMAIELEKTCSDQVLLGVISGALSHTILPFMVLSLICTLYLIYNNRKIAQKERELENIERGEKEKRDSPYTIDDYFNYADAALVTLVIVASIVSEALEQGIIEDVVFSISSLFYFVASATLCYCEYKKSKKHEVEKEQGFDDRSEKKTSNMSAAKLIFAGSSLLLVRKIMLVALASSAVGPALGLVGIALLMAGSGLIIHSYSRKLEDVEVSGKGVSTGAGAGNVRNGGQEPLFAR